MCIVRCVCEGQGSDGGSSTPFIVPNVANHLNQVNALVEDFISCALRKEGPDGILKGISQRLWPIREDTESWAYAPVAQEKCLRVVFAGSTTRWHRNGIMKGLLVEWWRVN